MVEKRACAQCGASLPNGVADVFCPACALRCALDADALPSATSPQPAEIAEKGIWAIRWLRRLQPRKRVDRSRQIALASAEDKERQCPTMTTAAPAPGE